MFGLGNQKTYPERFQAVGRAVDRRMLELGASAIVDRGEGDDNGRYDRPSAYPTPEDSASNMLRLP